MTREEAVTSIYDEFRDFEGLGASRIRAIFQQEYNKVIRKYRLETSRYTETTTWVSGTDHDPSADLTRWRGAPEAIASDDVDPEWARRDMFEIVRLRNQAQSGVDWSKWRGHRAYAVSGPDNKIHVVSALSAGVTLTVTHFAGPKTFTSDADEIDIPDDFVYMPIIMARIEVWKILNSNKSSTGQLSRLPEVLSLEYQEYQRMDKDLRMKRTMGEGVVRELAPPKLMQDFNNIMRHRRGRPGYYNRGEIV